MTSSDNNMPGEVEREADDRITVSRAALQPFLDVVQYMKGRNGIVTGWNHDRVTYADFRALAESAALTQQEKTDAE